jgi:dihydroorotate dehydrogenase subfamily 1
MSTKVPNLAVNFAGIESPNPFWLASAPPTNTGEQVMRAFDAGWGGAVWKTIGEPVTNTSSRYSSIDWNGQRMMGLNNIELISDRPIEVNLREIAEVKKRYPKHAVIASLMVESKREAWHTIVQQAEDAGADGLELNFGCPHGMSERGMGSAVGQVPEYAEMITAWVKERARTPVIVKLTPNISDIRVVARAAKRGGADALSAINTINSITGVDLDTFVPRPNVGGMSSHGGYCGPAVKPIALNLVEQVMNDPESTLPMSGIGGIANWRDAAEFILLGSGTVHGRDALWLSHRRGHDRRPHELDAREGLLVGRGVPRPQPCEGHRVEASRPELQDRRADRRIEVHWLRSLLHRVLGWSASVHSSGSGQRPCGWSGGGACEASGDRGGEPRPDRRDADPEAGWSSRRGERAVCHAAGADPAGGPDRVRWV